MRTLRALLIHAKGRAPSALFWGSPDSQRTNAVEQDVSS
jgi:hypothetical protein